MLTLPISNAVVERAFSIMNLTKTKLRNKMQTEMLNSLLTIKINLYVDNIQVSQKWRTNGALRCRRDYRKRQKNV
jgi:hypothetical protein